MFRGQRDGADPKNTGPKHKRRRETYMATADEADDEDSMWPPWRVTLMHMKPKVATHDVHEDEDRHGHLWETADEADDEDSDVIVTHEDGRDDETFRSDGSRRNDLTHTCANKTITATVFGEWPTGSLRPPPIFSQRCPIDLDAPKWPHGSLKYFDCHFEGPLMILLDTFPSSGDSSD